MPTSSLSRNAMPFAITTGGYRAFVWGLAAEPSAAAVKAGAKHLIWYTADIHTIDILGAGLLMSGAIFVAMMILERLGRAAGAISADQFSPSENWRSVLFGLGAMVRPLIFAGMITFAPDAGNMAAAAAYGMARAVLIFAGAWLLARAWLALLAVASNAGGARE